VRNGASFYFVTQRKLNEIALMSTTEAFGNSNIERQVKQTLFRFALIKTWTSVSVGIVLMVTAPFLVSDAEAAGAPMVRDFGFALLMIGACCTLLAIFAGREASSLRKHLGKFDDSVWSPPLFADSSLATNSPGTVQETTLARAHQVS
jgi:hypothetical protein